MTIAKYDDELRKARPAPVWRDISTAPKDGSEVLAFVEIYENPLILSYYKWNGHAAWRDWDTDPHKPTHWMPLPAAPGSQPEAVVEAARVDVPVGLVPELQQWVEDELETCIDGTMYQKHLGEFYDALRSLAAKGGE